MSNKNTTGVRIPKARTWFWRPFAQLADDVQTAFDTHGDLIELQGFFMRVYCLRSPLQIEQVLRHPTVGISKLPAVFPRLRAVMPTSTVVVSGGDAWLKCQNIMKNMLGNEYLQRYSEITGALTQQQIRAWSELARLHQTFDIYRDMQILLTKMGAQMLFSVDLSDDHAAELNDKCTFIELEFSKRLPPILPTSDDKRFRQYVGELRAWMRELIRQRKSENGRKLDLLQILCDRSDSLSEDWIVDHLIEMWNSIRLVNPPTSLALHLIAQHGTVQETLHDELSAAKLGPAFGFDETRNLPYLNMVLAEALRFYPSILLLPRWCADGMTIDRHVIPPRSLVVPMIYHVHRHPKIYPDPQRFDPDRWHPDVEKQIHSHARLAFGAGRRGCLGIKMAKDMIRTIIATLVVNYRFEAPSDSKPATQVDLTVHPKDPVSVRLTPRSSNEHFAPSLDTSILESHIQRI